MHVWAHVRTIFIHTYTLIFICMYVVLVYIFFLFWSEIKRLLVKNNFKYVHIMYVYILIAINFNKYYLMKMQAINIEIDNPYAHCFLFLLSEATYCAAGIVIYSINKALIFLNLTCHSNRRSTVKCFEKAYFEESLIWGS